MPAARSRALLACELDSGTAHTSGTGSEGLDEQVHRGAGADADRDAAGPPAPAPPARAPLVCVSIRRHKRPVREVTCRNDCARVSGGHSLRIRSAVTCATARVKAYFFLAAFFLAFFFAFAMLALQLTG